MILADNLRILGPILSSPVDFLTFKFNKNFLMKVRLVKGIWKSISFGTFDLIKLFNFLSLNKEPVLLI